MFRIFSRTSGFLLLFQRTKKQFVMTENDLKRLMARQYLLYKKLIEVEDKLKGRHCSHSDILLIKDFKEEVDKIVDTIDKHGLTL